MDTDVAADDTVRTGPASTVACIAAGLASLSAGAAAIHFAVMFEHFADYVLFGVFFLIVSWAQALWAGAAAWRPLRLSPRLWRLWLSLGIAGNAVVVAVYIVSRTTGVHFGPGGGSAEPAGGLDVMCAILEFTLIACCVGLLWRPSLAERPLPANRGPYLAGVTAATVIAACTAVMTPAWAGSEGPAGMAGMPGMSSAPSGTLASSGKPASSGSSAAGMGDMGSTDGLPDMKMYGSTAAPTAAQVIAAGQLVKETDATLSRYRDVKTAFAAGYTYILRTNGEEHLLYNGPNPAFAGLNPSHPSSLVYAINVPHHAPILLGAMYIEHGDTTGPQVGGSLTRWHSHLVVCEGGKQIIAGFGVALRDPCNPATWTNQYTEQMLHVWVVPYPGGVFSDDLSLTATNAAAKAALSQN